MSLFNLFIGLLACLVTWVIFLIFPNIDITIASYFYDNTTNSFIGNSSSLLTFLHYAARVVPIVISILGILFLMLIIVKGFKFKYKKELLYLLVCLWVGPGIIVNVFFKDNWGRPRPVMVKELGGEKVFQQPFVISKQCHKNCSFVCGDASIGFWLMAFVPLIATFRRRLAMLGVSMIAGGSLGLMRMSQGGHFFSDVIFCGIFIYISTAIVYLLFYKYKK